MTETAEKINPSEKLAASLEAQIDNLPGAEFFHKVRAKGLAAFKSLGLPQRKNEEYKYSPVGHLFKDKIEIAGKPEIPSFSKNQIQNLRISGFESSLITILNGEISEALSDRFQASPGITIRTLKDLSAQKNELMETEFGQFADVLSDAFIALNTASFRDVLFIEVAPGTILDKPLMILNISQSTTPAIISPRILLHVGKNASLSVIELFLNPGEGSQVLNNSVAEIVLEENAKTLYYKFQEDCRNLNLISTTQVSQAAGSHFDTHTLTLEGNWIRNNLNIVLNGTNCETHLNGLFLLRGAQHVDNHTLVDHRMPHCESNQVYKGILDEKSFGVFNGKIYVRPDAQKTNAYQSSKNMILSNEAEINTKPQLEIYADDVKCSHGSSTGRIDEEALFYLRARGLSLKSAKSLLLLAFARDVLNTIRIAGLREHAEALIEKRLTLFHD